MNRKRSRKATVDRVTLRYLVSGSLVEAAELDDEVFFENLSLTFRDMKKIYETHKETIDRMADGTPWIATELQLRGFIK